MPSAETLLIEEVSAPLLGMPAFLAGSLVAAETYDIPFAFSDVDIFCGSPEAIIACGQKLLDNGFTLNDRNSRVWARWVSMGFKSWHTNSLKLESPNGDEVNLIFKKTEGHPTTSLAQVLESFDFGLLGVGYDLLSGQPLRRDMRSYLFPDLNPDGPLPLMPNKRSNWRSGFISQYNGTRELGRYAKYCNYGYDLSAVRDDLLTGYQAAADYHDASAIPDKQLLGKIYAGIIALIESDDIPAMLEAGKEIIQLDSLDLIMEALE